ncbi:MULTISPECIES: DUF1254 domain-containing protein [unclassified Mesorhizobium]|uniref:DUF1254 domain-containing protein n=1 Tax=unclassified Mesorhizobium TaxID=325217 RepID=UPI000FD77821|nr:MULTISPECIES: DUF1254 domain-containing protein [unclassified Mesorhizobium]TGR48627.1 DUF1254 domain-containing protein [bacterium M00.F.Ca.ET.199.01.1.1]TGU37669.1 DUF1254 domain-containing protein [bacterium M00.F.Ca.ET.156.01.1.1]TGV88915.1 DUF1254 domain-containing protein [Mesorhizobium sp. M00.F.Ca.ET.149.01.1.1]TIT53651.1 MAG: DUF1254 domain-containing protein [Mesorhizobium sp.]TGR30318.1 DUF1254 domain-containing protein [Mesorhizobium sp. M8A.F.Ca.ET.202.01.1.1]
MNISRRAVSLGGLGLLAATSQRPTSGHAEGLVGDLMEGSDDFGLAVEAYTYGYPLVTMEMTRRVITNVAKPKGTKAPMGNLIKVREYPNAQFRDVTAPNADTLYTTAFLDVGKEPWVVSLPDLQDRYALFPMLDGWTTVFDVPGKRTTGTGAQTFAVTGPGWEGTLPDGVKQYKSPTSIVWLLGRIYCTGTPEDYAAVHKVQDEVKLYPLSAHGKEWTPPPGKVDQSIDMKTAVRDQVNKMDAVEYFTLLAELMKTNPPTEADAPMVEKMAQIGIVPGQDFDKTKFNPAFATRVPQIAFDRIMLHFKFSDGDVKQINGWGFTTKTGIYGTNYIQRALVTAIGLGANRPQDAIYPTSMKSHGDLINRAYSGSDKYVLTFKKGLTPPVTGFWSVTMYDADYFFVDNPLNRYSISARQPLKANDDGSIDILIQNESPGADKEANWLPAPKGKFVLMMRTYWPNESDPSIIDGSWTIPPVKKVS